MLQLVIVWCTGIGVLVRCFTQKATFEKEISHRLGRSFPRVPYIIVVVWAPSHFLIIKSDGLTCSKYLTRCFRCSMLIMYVRNWEFCRCLCPC